MHSQMVMLPMT